LGQFGTVPVAIDGPGPRVGPDAIARVFLYPLWRASGAKQKTFIHVDAHHDIWRAKPQAPITIALYLPACMFLQMLFCFFPQASAESA